MPQSHRSDLDASQLREELASTLDRDDLSSVLDRDELSSARTFYQAGRGSYDRGDLRSAQLYFGLAAKLFSKSSENVNAHIARQWYKALSQRRPRL